MALGKNWNTRSEYAESRKNGLEFVHKIHNIAWKRVVSNCFVASNSWRRGRGLHIRTSNRLESLPQDLLVTIICKLSHDDLKQLLFVSKFVREATIIARDWHFTFSTPSSKPIVSEYHDSDNDEPPKNARMQGKVPRSRITPEELGSIATVSLFGSQEEKWTNGDVDMFHSGIVL